MIGVVAVGDGYGASRGATGWNLETDHADDVDVPWVGIFALGDGDLDEAFIIFRCQVGLRLLAWDGCIFGDDDGVGVGCFPGGGVFHEGEGAVAVITDFVDAGGFLGEESGAEGDAFIHIAAG